MLAEAKRSEFSIVLWKLVRIKMEHLYQHHQNQMKSKVMKGSLSWLSMTTIIIPTEDLNRSLTLQRATLASYKITSSRISVQQLSPILRLTSLSLLMTLLKDHCLKIFYILQLIFALPQFV